MHHYGSQAQLPLLLKFELSKIEGKVVLTDLQAKLFYNYAEITNGNVQTLQLLDYQNLIANTQALDGDINAKKEFEELKTFAETYLLKGNLDRFLIKE